MAALALKQGEALGVRHEEGDLRSFDVLRTASGTGVKQYYLLAASGRYVNFIIIAVSTILEY